MGHFCWSSEKNSILSFSENPQGCHHRTKIVTFAQVAVEKNVSKKIMFQNIGVAKIILSSRNNFGSKNLCVVKMFLVRITKTRMNWIDIAWTNVTWTNCDSYSTAIDKDGQHPVIDNWYTPIVAKGKFLMVWWWWGWGVV